MSYQKWISKKHDSVNSASYSGLDDNLNGTKSALQVLNGAPGYMNILGALNSWQLVDELRQATGLPAAASFRYVTPIGAAIGIPLNTTESKSYMVENLAISSKQATLAAACARIKGVDKIASLNDFVALSEKCDDLTARIINREVSEGVVAPDFNETAMSMFGKKRSGNFIILKIDPKLLPSNSEERTVFGLRLRHKKSGNCINENTFDNIVSVSKHLPSSVKNDLILALITIKFMQSNSACIAYHGQVIGLCTGERSHKQCIHIACQQSSSWLFSAIMDN